MVREVTIAFPKNLLIEKRITAIMCIQFGGSIHFKAVRSRIAIVDTQDALRDNGGSFRACKIEKSIYHQSLCSIPIGMFLFENKESVAKVVKAIEDLA